MKHLIYLSVCLILATCARTATSGSQDFAGTYTLNTTDFANQISNDGEDELSMAFAKMLLSTVEFQFTFYPDGNGYLSVSGAAVNFVQAFTNELDDQQTSAEFTYELKHDSLLTIHYPDEEEPAELIVRQRAGHYDHVYFVSKDGEVCLPCDKTELVAAQNK